MTSPRHFTTFLTLLSGFLLSIIALLASDPLCDAVQQRRLRSVASQHTATVADSLENSLKAIHDLATTAANVANTSKLNATRFAELAQNVTNRPGIYSVEWIPRVSPQERSTFEADMAREHGEAVSVMTWREGRTVVVSKDQVVHPTLYVHPSNESTKAYIGFQRGRWAAWESASTWDRPFLTPGNRFFSHDLIRLGVFVAAGEIEDRLGPPAMIFATLDGIFDQQALATKDTTVVTADITAPDYWPNTADTVQDRTLHEVESGPDAYKARKQIGGRLFEFIVTENNAANFRPIWIPWSLFFLCNVLAWLFGMRIYQREAVGLQSHNRKLQQEIEKRIATERQLHSTLDFRDQERELVAHEIHDGFVQDVVGAQMFVEATLATLPPDQSRLRDNVTTVAQLLAQSIEEARRTINYLKPKVVDEVGLVAAIQSFVAEDLERYGFETEFITTSDFPRLPLLAERILYRMVRETVSNVRQHSGEDSARVCLSADEETIVLEIVDRGCGFDPDTTSDGERFGLTGLRHRAEVLNGSIAIKTSKLGTKIIIEVPLDMDLPPQPSNESLVTQE